MSRIRSIHPGLWTDEAFVSLSPMARLMLMGIWNECDDMGSFAWSPLTLKMRLLPADSVDASELLAEMIASGVVCTYEIGGNSYGAVRNFCRFQRPKKPNSLHPQTDEIREWVGTEARSTRDGSAPVPNQSETPSEKSRQMEDGGGKKKGEPNGSLVNGDAVAEPELLPEHVVEAWNDTAERYGLAKVQKLTRERLSKVRARIRENTLDDFKAALLAIERSPFLRGESKGGWKADFDFFCQKSSFTKLIEGSYGH